MFSNPFPNAFGLDVSDLSIKVVQLRNISHRHLRPSFQPVIYRSVDLPHGMIVNGEIQEPELVRKRIYQLLFSRTKNKKPTNGRWAVVSLPETQTFIKHLTVPKTLDDLSEEDVLYAAKKHIPFDEDSYYIDWQIVPSTAREPENSDVIIGAVPKNIANSYTYLLKSLGLGVIALEIEALSIARSMITAKKEYGEEARGLLDLGATRSSFIVYDHDSIQFSNSLPFSGEILTTALAQKLGVSYEEAERRKVAHGLDVKNNRGKAFQILSNLMDGLVENLKKSIQFYQTHFPNPNRINHITMVGGTANLKRIDAVLTNKLKIETKPGKPWKNLMYNKDIPVSREESLSYATAIGLALRAADNPFFKHDIL